MEIVNLRKGKENFELRFSGFGLQTPVSRLQSSDFQLEIPEKQLYY